MFTGRIREVGVVSDVGDTHVVISSPKVADLLQVGGSVAVAGVGLTTCEVGDSEFGVMLSVETRHRSTLAELAPGVLVNVEPALRVGDPLDGHVVQGHVDAVGKVTRVEDEGIGRRVWVRTNERALAELVPKGSVALDGVSLSVAEVLRDRFSVALVPSTLTDTTLSELSVGQRVNLEPDLVARVARCHAEAAGASLAAVISSLPWAGPLTGRLGVEKAVAQLAAGAAVVVWDPVREGEGDVVFAGARLRPEAVTFLLTQVCGHTTVPCDLERLERLEIPALPGAGDRHGTAPHLPVDLASSKGTGISPAERSATIRRLAHPDARPVDFLRPGHVFPLGARSGGLPERAGHTEASIALCRAAALPTVAVVCEVMSPGGTMAGEAELERFALRWGLPMLAIEDLATWL